MTNWQVFILRAVMGAVFAVVIGRAFFQQVNSLYVAGLGIILVGLAYFAEYLRTRK